MGRGAEIIRLRILLGLLLVCALLLGNRSAPAVATPAETGTAVTTAPATAVTPVVTGAPATGTPATGAPATSIPATATPVTGTPVVPVPEGAPAWQWQNPLPHGTSLSSVSCPHTHACYAAGSGTIMVSHDGGATWTTTFDRAKGGIAALACPDAATCYAIANTGVNSAAVIVTADGGAGWTSVRTGKGGWDQIVCPTTTVCYVTGTYTKSILITRDGGRSWVTRKVGFEPVDITCPSAMVCYTPISTTLITSPPPSVAVTTNGGSSWTLHTVGIPKGGAQLSTTRCVSATTCIVIGYGAIERPFALITTNAGKGWQRHDFALDVYFRGAALACPSTTICYLGGDNGTTGGVFVSTTNGGQSWTRGSPLPFVPSRLSCGSTSSCVAVGAGGALLRTTDGFKHRTFETVNVVHGSVPNAFPTLHALTCPSRAVCYTGGDWAAMAKTTNGGARWTGVGSSLNLMLRGGNIGSVACATSSVCFAGAFSTYGDAATLASTRDGGKTWSAKPGSGLGSVDCPSTTVCYAGGPRGAIARSGDGGTTWKTGTTPLKGKAYAIQHLVCPTTLTCYATALGPSELPPHPSSNVGALLVTSDGGTTWRSTPADPYPFDLTCPTPSDCIALVAGPPVNGIVPTLETHNGGKTWTKKTRLPPGYWHALTCPDASTCVLVGSSGAITVSHDGGATWQAEDSPTFDELDAVTCVDPNTCYAAGQFSAILLRP